MHIHPNFHRNGRDAKDEAIELARLHSGYSIYPKKNRPLYYYDNSIKVSNRKMILDHLKRLTRLKKLPKEDREFWKEVLTELLKIPDTPENEESIISKKPKKPKKGFFKWFKTPLIIIGTLAILFGSRIIDGFTPVDTLTERIHERSKYTFSGSMCNDGHVSHSQGRGSCSWHGGVSYKFYRGEFSRTIDECREEAIKLSWVS